MKYFFFSLLFAFHISIYAQIPTSNDNKNDLLQKRSKIEQIDHLRNLMVDALVEEDYQKIGSYEKALLELGGNRYVGLFPYELMALKYLTFEFEEVLAIITYLDTAASTGNNKITPTNNRLGYILRDELLDRQAVTIQTIKNSQLKEEKKQLLEIQHILLLGNADTTMTQDSLNHLSKVFLEQHPNSTYRSFVSNNAYYEFAASNWGFGLDFFMGFGTFDGDLGQQFGNVFSFGIAFEIQYKSTTLYLRNYLGFSKTKQDIRFQEDLWKADETTLVFLPEASLGYQIFENKKIKISPFAGISSLDLGPTLDKTATDAYDKLTLGFRSAPCIGLNLDLKLHDIFNFVSTLKPERSTAIIKLRYSYHDPNYSSRFDGGIHSIVIGYGGFGRTLKRIELE